jgi:hypothetical protein
MSDSPPKDQPKIADANQGAANSGDNSGLKFEGYKVPLTSDQKIASAGTRELGLSNFSNMDDHLKNLKYPVAHLKAKQLMANQPTSEPMR